MIVWPVIVTDPARDFSLVVAVTASSDQVPGYLDRTTVKIKNCLHPSRTGHQLTSESENLILSAIKFQVADGDSKPRHQLLAFDVCGRSYISPSPSLLERPG